MMELAVLAIVLVVLVLAFVSARRQDRLQSARIAAYRQAGCNCLIDEGCGLTVGAWTGGPPCPIHGPRVWDI